MIRGTTPTFTLTLLDDNVDLTEASNVYASFKQAPKNNCFRESSEEVRKFGQDIVVRKNEVDVYFNQTDSLGFKEGRLYIQLNWTYSDGSRACSNIISVPVGPNLAEEELA